MEPLNFIKTLSSADYKSLARWHSLSRIACGITFVAIALFQGYQWYTLYTLYCLKQQLPKNPTAHEKAVLNEYQEFQTQLILLKKQKDALTVLASKRAKFLQSLKAIAQCLNYSCLLESCTITPTGVTLTLQAPSMNLFMEFLEQVPRHEGLKNVRIVSLKMHQKKVIATLESTL